MAIPIINDWEKYFTDPHEGLGSSYERVVINNLLKRTADRYGVKSVLESPSFGFTGISGINLLSLADLGIRVYLEDHDERRLDLIGKLWSELGRPLQTAYNRDYRKLDYPDSSIDMYFSFSALWFAQDLPCFLREVSRVTDKVIFISVPNITGLGYKMQIKDYSPQKYPDLRLGNIDRKSMIFILGKLGWNCVRRDGSIVLLAGYRYGQGRFAGKMAAGGARFPDPQKRQCRPQSPLVDT